MSYATFGGGMGMRWLFGLHGSEAEVLVGGLTALELVGAHRIYIFKIRLQLTKSILLFHKFSNWKGTEYKKRVIYI